MIRGSDYDGLINDLARGLAIAATVITVAAAAVGAAVMYLVLR